MRVYVNGFIGVRMKYGILFCMLMVIKEYLLWKSYFLNKWMLFSFFLVKLFFV